MKTINIGVAFVALLVLNNVALLYYIDHSSDDGLGQVTSVNHRPTAVREELHSQTAEMPLNKPLGTEPKTPEPKPTQGQMEVAIENYVQSQDFISVLEDWQFESQQRLQEMQRSIVTMDGNELYQAMMQASSRTEQTIAYSELLQKGKLRDLSNDQLKALYDNKSIYQWGHKKLLELLLERDDPTAILLAKQSILNPSALEQYSTGEIYAAVYESDPEFIKRYILDSNFDLSSVSHGMLSFMQKEPEIGRDFYTKNFDELLNSNNDDLFMYTAGARAMELSERQQSRLSELLDSKNRRKRNFALSLVASIKEPEVLREAFSKLSRTQDKRAFISYLNTSKVSAEVLELARELAASSDDPAIQ